MTIPDTKGRTVVLQMLDAYTNIPFTVGTSHPALVTARSHK
jgi:hypothetical protein